MELTERKKKVLRAVVDLYIRTAEPVGSKAIAAAAGHELFLRDHPQRNGGADRHGLSGAAPHLAPGASPPPPVTGCTSTS